MSGTPARSWSGSLSGIGSSLGGWTLRSCGGSWLDTCPRRGRATAKVTVVAVRQLLAFLYVEGAIDRPLVGAVPSVAGARLSGLPKRLGHGEVQRGRRDQPVHDQPEAGRLSRA